MRTLLAVLVALALQDDVTKGWKSPWAGATVGSRLKWKVTTEAVGQKETLERTERVTQVDAESVTVESQEKDEKNEDTHPLTLPGELEGPWKKTGDQEIKVGDKAFNCAVYEWKKEEFGAVQTTRVWKSGDAPHWAVKATFTHVQGGTEILAWTEELIQLSEGVTVAGKEMKCRVVRKSTRPAGLEMIDTTWITDELPGRAARKTTEHRIAGMKALTKVSELIEVQKK
jgi:hypothetical protein